MKTGRKRRAYGQLNRLILTSVLLCAALFLLVSCFDGVSEQTTDAVQTVPETTAPAETSGVPVTEATPEQTADTEPERLLMKLDGEVICDSLRDIAGPFEISGSAWLEYSDTLPGHALKTVICEYENGRIQQFGVQGGAQNGRVSLTGEGRFAVSLVITENGTDYIYVSSPGLFGKICTDPAYSGCRVRLNTDIEAGDTLVISVPFEIETCGHYIRTGSLSLESETDGRMVFNIGAGEIICDTLRCRVPGWDISVTAPFCGIVENGFSNVLAKTVNGKPVDTKNPVIRSTEDYSRFFGGEFSDLAADAESICFCGELTLTDMTFTGIKSLLFSGNVDISGKIKIISTAPELKIDTSGNGIKLYEKMDITAPDTNLCWQGYGSPDAGYAGRYYNIDALNGENTDKYTGGRGVGRVTEISASGFEGYVDGNRITVPVTYTSAVDYTTAVISAKVTDGCTYKQISADGRHYLTVTDKMNQTYGYELVIDYSGYKIPVIRLETDDGVTVDARYIDFYGTFSIDYNNYCGLQSSSFSGARMTIHGRGNTSWELDKKSYTVKLDEKKSLFGLNSARDWVLVANHADYSLIRNPVALSIGRVLDNMVFVPHCYPVDVFMNGQYIGLYTLSEQIEVHAGRIECEENSTEVDTDYLLEMGGRASRTSFGYNTFTTELCIYMEIANPQADVLTQEQFRYINSYFNKADAAVMALSNYEDYIDIDSLIDWFILTELTYNTDGAMRRSVFFLKEKGGKIKVCTPWDFDYAFGNLYYDTKYEEWICLSNDKIREFAPKYGDYVKTNWMTYLLTDQRFLDKLQVRWNEVKEQVRTAAFESIDRLEEETEVSAADNFTVWSGIIGTRIQYQSRPVMRLKTRKANVEYLRTFLKHRYEWMDGEINKKR